MSSSYKLGGYYEWDAYKGLEGKLHEGSIKTFVEKEKGNGKRFIFQDYISLFNWAVRHQDSEHLLSDSLYLCEKINEKIRKCSKIANKPSEYNKNKIRLRILNNRAAVLRDVEPDNRSFLKSQIESAYLLHDYSQLADILEEAVEKGSHYDIDFVRRSYRRKEIPANIKKLNTLQRKRDKYEAGRYPGAGAVFLSAGIPSEIQPALQEHIQEESDKPASQYLLEHADAFHRI